MTDKIEDWEEVCPECNGEKFIMSKDENGELVGGKVCRKCYGKGKINWLDKVIKKESSDIQLMALDVYMTSMIQTLSEYKSKMFDDIKTNHKKCLELLGINEEEFNDIFRKDK